MKNFWMTLLPVALVVAGCSNSASPSDKPANMTSGEGKPSTGTLKVALLTPGPVSDNGWSAMALDLRMRGKRTINPYSRGSEDLLRDVRGLGLLAADNPTDPTRNRFRTRVPRALGCTVRRSHLATTRHWWSRQMN